MTGHVPLLTDLQLSFTTADEEAAHFWGEHTPVPHVDMAARFPAGLYRVIDGQVYRIVSGAPAEWTEPKCPACGETRLIERVQTGRWWQWVCHVCDTTW